MFYQVIKRLIDIIISFLVIIIFSPVIIFFILLIFLEDYNNPFYVADRVGKKNKIFKMIKLRSMAKVSNSKNIDSTSSNDPRITKVGKTIRRFKIDELSQLFNVLIGQMSLVGPRPNVQREVRIYSDLEKKILNVKPGITDFASIIFSNEGEIINGYPDPDIAYNQLIRPWKSKLAIFYVENKSLYLDFFILILTCILLFNKAFSHRIISYYLFYKTKNKDLAEICNGKKKLEPTPPPGLNSIVTRREI